MEKIIPDLKGGAAGRAWLHKKCAEGAISRGAFVFAFKTNSKAQTEAVDVSELQQYLLTNEWI